MIVFVMLSAAGRRDIWSGPSAVADDRSLTRSKTSASCSFIAILILGLNILLLWKNETKMKNSNSAACGTCMHMSKLQL